MSSGTARAIRRELAGEEIPSVGPDRGGGRFVRRDVQRPPLPQGMPDEKNQDSILRDGAGQQWDANVVATLFTAKTFARSPTKPPMKPPATGRIGRSALQRKQQRITSTMRRH